MSGEKFEQTLHIVCPLFFLVLLTLMSLFQHVVVLLSLVPFFEGACRAYDGELWFPLGYLTTGDYAQRREREKDLPLEHQRL